MLGEVGGILGGNLGDEGGASQDSLRIYRVQPRERRGIGPRRGSIPIPEPHKHWAVYVWGTRLRKIPTGNVRCLGITRARLERAASGRRGGQTCVSTELPRVTTPEPWRRPAGAYRPLRTALLSYRSKPHCGGQGIYLRHLSPAPAAPRHPAQPFSSPPYPNL